MREKINLNTVTECTCTSGKKAWLLIKTYLIPFKAIFIFEFYPRLIFMKFTFIVYCFGGTSI